MFVFADTYVYDIASKLFWNKFLYLIMDQL